MDSSHLLPRSELLKRAREGNAEALATLLASVRNLHRVLVKVRDDKDLRKKIDTSDVLQETEMQALKDFVNFRGESVGEFICWLREILHTKRAKAARLYRTKKRDMTLEQELELGMEESAQALASLAHSDDTSPVDRAIQRERELQVSDALEKLPESQREVAELHYIQEMTLREVGERIGKSENAVQKLWARALTKLREIVKENS